VFVLLVATSSELVSFNLVKKFIFTFQFADNIIFYIK